MWEDVTDAVLGRGLRREPRSASFLRRRKSKASRRVVEFGLTMEQHYREQLGKLKSDPKSFLLKPDIYALDRRGRLKRWVSAEKR